MSYTPVLPLNGYVGWMFLKRTMDTQISALVSQPSNQREETYFRENIGKIDTAQQLVDDPRLLRVALTAFGLENDIKNKFFIQKVLSDGTIDPAALSNRLANKQYHKLSSYFGFGNGSTPKTKISDFTEGILLTYRRQKFSIAVGEKNTVMRLALNFEKELPALAKSSASENSKWFTILGTPPLRSVFETAFGLPTAFGAIDIDRQVETLKQRSQVFFGSDLVSQFDDPLKIDKLTKQFLLRSDLSTISAVPTGGQIALTLLQSMRGG